MTTWRRKRRSSGTGVQPKKKTISGRSQRPNERRPLFLSKRYRGSKGEEREDNNETSMLTMTSSSEHKEKIGMIDNSSSVILPLMTTHNANSIFPRMTAAAAMEAASPIDIAPEEGIINNSESKSSRQQQPQPQQQHRQLLPDNSFVESLDSLESLFSSSNSISMESLETLPPFSPLTPTPFKKSVAVAGGQLPRQQQQQRLARQSLIKPSSRRSSSSSNRISSSSVLSSVDISSKSNCSFGSDDNVKENVIGNDSRDDSSTTTPRSKRSSLIKPPSWRSSSRNSTISNSEASSVDDSDSSNSNRSFGLDDYAKENATGNAGTDSKTSISTGAKATAHHHHPSARRRISKLFSPSPKPKRLFKSAVPMMAQYDDKGKEKDDDDPSWQRDRKSGERGVATTPLKPLSYIARRQTQLLSPLTPFAISPPESALTDGGEGSTPRTTNTGTTSIALLNNDAVEDELETLEHLKQPAIDNDDDGTATNDTCQNEAVSKTPAEQSLQVTSSENDTELQSALDSLGQNLKELRQLDSPAGDSNTSGVFSEFSKDDGYNEFLSIIQSNESFIVEVADAADATLAAVEAAFGSPAGRKEEGVAENCGTKELENEISKLAKSSECMEDAGVGSEEDPREEQVEEDTFSNETTSESDLEKEEEEDTNLVPGDGANSDDINASDAITVDGMKPKDSLGEKIMAGITTPSNQNLVTNEFDAGKANPSQDGAMEEESSSDGDDCHCFWFPEPLLALLRGSFNAKNHTRQSAIIIAPMPPQAPPTKECDNSIQNVEGKMQQSVESLRADMKAMMEHAAQLRMLSSTHDEQLIIGEIRVIQKSLDKISSSWINSTEGN